MWAAVCISKNACTSLKQRVCLDLGVSLSRKEEIHDHIGYSTSSPFLHAVALGPPAGYRTFAVWRDPAERFISVYKHFAIEKHASRIPCSSLDIDAWIDWVERELQKPIQTQDEHARRQVDYYSPEDVDVIVTLDDLNEWFYQQGHGHLRAMNRSHAEIVVLTEDQRARIRAIYEEDYKLATHCVLLNERRLVVSGFWESEHLSPIAELCMRSYMDHGHRFQLYSYQKIKNLPEGVESCDANDLLPEQSHPAAQDQHGSLMVERLRARYLASRGGFWAELDTVCLRKIPHQSTPWFVSLEHGVPSTGLLGFDAGHPLFLHLDQLCADPATVMPWDGAQEQRRKQLWKELVPDLELRRNQFDWGSAGVLGIPLGGSYFRICKKEDSVAYPVSSNRWMENFDGTLSLDATEFAEAYLVKLWADNFAWDPHAMLHCAQGSVVAQLMRRHHMSGMNVPASQSSHAKIMVGICSCHKYPEKRQAVRETWLSVPTENIECRFFVGAGDALHDEPDTVVLPASDSYEFLPEKVRAFFVHCLETSDFEWLFKCDDDTYLALDRLHSLIVPGFDLVGDVLLAQRGAPSGGAGYMLSRELVEAIVRVPTPSTGAEDLIFGEAALQLGAKGYSTDRLCWNTKYYPRKDNDVVSAHWCSPNRMHAIHTIFVNSPLKSFQVDHQHWNDRLFLYENGVFTRASTYCSGDWHEEEDGALNLNWYDWGKERVLPCKEGYQGPSMKLSPSVF